MWKKIAIRPLIVFVLGTVMILSLAATGCTPEAPSSSPSPTAETVITPADSPILPPLGFYRGLLPIPSDGQSFAEAHHEASRYAEFVPVWGRPTPFYRMAAELSGEWGQVFVEQYIRGNDMFPLVHMSFIGAGMILESPPDIPAATLNNPDWRKAYREAALGIVRAVRPLYLSLGNEVNRWYEQYGAESSDPNGFQHYVSLYSSR